MVAAEVTPAGPVTVELSVYDPTDHLIGSDPGTPIPAGRRGATIRIRVSPGGTAARVYLFVTSPNGAASSRTAGCPLGAA